MSRWLPLATVAIEDRRFYSHGGIDAEGIARALWRDLNARRVVEGGSTITQQLVRTLYISNERTVERKVTEACLAVKLDRKWSKERILATYLNSVFYGNLAYGAEAAARTYFSRSARALTLSQAALLAGLTKAPSAYDPFVDPARAVARRNEVLLAMLQERMITPKQYASASRARSAGLHPGISTRRSGSRTSSASCGPARAGVRRRDRPLRRPACLHDDRAASPAPRARGDLGER